MLRFGGDIQRVMFYVVLVDSEMTVLPNGYVFRSRYEAQQFQRQHDGARLMETQGWA